MFLNCSCVTQEIQDDKEDYSGPGRVFLAHRMKSGCASGGCIS